MLDTKTPTGGTPVAETSVGLVPNHYVSDFIRGRRIGLLQVEVMNAPRKGMHQF